MTQLKIHEKQTKSNRSQVSCLLRVHSKSCPDDRAAQTRVNLSLCLLSGPRWAVPEEESKQPGGTEMSPDSFTYPSAAVTDDGVAPATE